MPYGLLPAYNGTKTAIDYDAEDHITKLVNTCGVCGEVISSYEYTYNEQGYVVGEKSSELEAGTRKSPSWDDWYNWGGTKQESCGQHKHNEKTIKTSRTYEYDDNWELTRCTEKVEGGTKTVHNYTYDKVGNRTIYERLEDGITKVKYKYQYNDSNQLVKKTDARVWGNKGIVYQYDEDGNLTSRCDKNSSSRPVTYEYTAENRLAVVEKGGTVLMAAMYDGDNNRVFQIDNTRNWEDQYGDAVLIPESQRTENGDSPKEELASVVEKGADAKGYVLTEYINDINRQNTQVLAEYGADDTLQKAYTYGDNRISVDKAEESSYYLYDGRTSVTGLLTEAGTLANSYTYDSYGNLSSGTPDAVNYYGYNAESTNTNTGFQYLRARYYNPETGTFTTEDSDLGTTENPLTRNRYAYVGNNPLNYSDPTGHRASPAAAATVAKRGISRTVKNLIKVRQSVSSRNGERPPVRTFKLSSDYQNAQKAKTNARKAKNSASWISNITKRLREAHVKEFCTSKKEKVKTDWKEIGKTVLWGMTFSFRVNMYILGKGLYEIGKFLTSPMTRVFASSVVEAFGAFMVINGFLWAPAAAAMGATGAGAPAVALDVGVIAAGMLLFFGGDSGRQQAVDDLAEEASHGKEDSYTGGRTQQELDDLARDPSHGNKITDQGIKEREIGLDLEEKGKLGRIIRDPQADKGAEFIDETTGLKWDVKSFESYPNGHTSPKKGAFTVDNAMKKIYTEMSNGHNVIIDTRNLVAEHVSQLQQAIDAAGIGDSIIWYP